MSHPPRLPAAYAPAEHRGSTHHSAGPARDQ